MKVLVVGDGVEETADHLTEANLDERTSIRAAPEPSDAVTDWNADVLVPVGEPSLLSVVRSGAKGPILPVDIGPGVEDVSRADLPAALRVIVDHEHTTTTIPTVEVGVSGDQYRAVMDVMVVTAEPAKISEYRVSGRRTDADTCVDTVRSDGIVVATPAGTPGYGTAAGGPILDRALEAVAVVPVGPFRVEKPHWVLTLPLEIRVVREEVPVVLAVDDREIGEIPPGEDVELKWGDPIEVVRTPVSRSAPGGVDGFRE